jgi:hypothetical protein
VTAEEKNEVTGINGGNGYCSNIGNSEHPYVNKSSPPIVEIRLWRYANQSLVWFGAAGYRELKVQLEPNCYVDTGNSMIELIPFFGLCRDDQMIQP